MKNKLILMFCFLVGLFVLSACDSNPNVLKGDGTLNNPYEIKTVKQFIDIENDLSAHYILKNDIDLEGVNWDPFGDVENIFSGTLDGRGYSILNLQPSTNYNQEIGLFSEISELGKIYNLTITGSISSDVMVQELDNGYGNGVGAFAGINYGTIDNCYNNMESIYIEYNTSAIDTVIWTGGITGINFGIISNSGNYSEIEISTNDSFIGGITGTNHGLIKNCFNKSGIRTITPLYDDSMVGGISGSDHGSIASCYNTGNIGSDYAAGGI